MKSKQQKDFEKVSEDWQTIKGDFKNASDAISDVLNGFESVVDIVLGITGLTIEANKEFFLAYERYLNKLKEKRNLTIKQFTLGLTYAEKKRLHDCRQETV